MKNRILESVMTALLIAVLGAAVSTYIEVRMLRKDVDQLQKSLDELWADTSEQVQKLTPDRKDR
ncbi:MAG: hypothetical protein A2Y61_02560 [Chloroflexi bacterium RBG_13_60_13]|nr:MAG: hypothetical protein A2Y61_02560 [Chloroflexi bacterium RBG_13_60_13]